MPLSLSRLFYIDSHFMIFHAYMYRVFCHKFCLLLSINGLLTCLRGPQGRLVPPIGSPSINKVYLLTYLLTYSIPMLRRPALLSSSSSSFTIFKNLLLRNRLANQSQFLCGAFLGRGNQSLYKLSRSHDQDGRHAHIW